MSDRSDYRKQPVSRNPAGFEDVLGTECVANTTGRNPIKFKVDSINIVSHSQKSAVGKTETKEDSRPRSNYIVDIKKL
jgi:hypothetical protein